MPQSHVDLNEDADRWHRDAEVAATGSEWTYISSLIVQRNASLTALYAHAITRERRRVALSAGHFFDRAQRVEEIRRQLGIDHTPA